MKNFITVLFFALAFSLGANAQEAKKGPQKEAKTEMCCADHAHASATQIAACKEKSTASADGKAAAAPTAKKECKSTGSCCSSGKSAAKKV